MKDYLGQGVQRSITDLFVDFSFGGKEEKEKKKKKKKKKKKAVALRLTVTEYGKQLIGFYLEFSDAIREADGRLVPRLFLVCSKRK